MLIGELTPDTGEVERGTNVQVAYYDQQREQLDPKRTVFDTVGDGNDTVTVNGRTQHLHGYLRDFLFPPERAYAKVKALSGGERNRLLLARLLTRPANVLVLDEPTNDLDIETLELLESYLIEWPGTLLLVSHDRAFIDHVVTSTLVFESGGHVQEYVGGYEDWLRQRGTREMAAEAQPERAERTAEPPVTMATRKKPTYREQKELDQLPVQIEALEREQAQLTASIADPHFYRQPADSITEALARLEILKNELHDTYARWEKLDSRITGERA
jgi:ATP-binding cassette subfamily F protein uup